MPDDPVVTWPSEACEKAFWERVAKARAAGEPGVSLLGLPDMPEPLESDAFRKLPTIIQNMLIATSSKTPETLEMYERYRFLCAIVSEVAVSHGGTCLCKICSVLEHWLQGNNDADMLKNVYHSK